jgi:hypothetical protein
MYDVRFTELEALHALAKKAKMSKVSKHITLGCIDQLPRLYQEFCRTNESRYGDTIAGLAQAILKQLAEGELGAGARGVAEALVTQLGHLHERLGFAPLRLKIGTLRAATHSLSRTIGPPFKS